MITNPERNPKIAYYQCPGCWHAETESAVKNMVVDMTCPTCKAYKISQFVPVTKIESESIFDIGQKYLIEALTTELQNQWEMNHDERCDNTHGCASFGNQNKSCHYPRPAILSQVAISVCMKESTDIPFLTSVAINAVQMVMPDGKSTIYKFDAGKWREATATEVEQIANSIWSELAAGGFCRMPVPSQAGNDDENACPETLPTAAEQWMTSTLQHWISAAESAFRIRLPWGKGSGKISE